MADSLAGWPSKPNIHLSKFEIEDSSQEQVFLKWVLELPEQLRMIFILKYYQGCTVAMIAELINCPVGHVRSSLRQVNKSIKDSYLLQSHGIESPETSKKSGVSIGKFVIEDLLSQIAKTFAHVARSNDEMVTKLERV